MFLLPILCGFIWLNLTSCGPTIDPDIPNLCALSCNNGFILPPESKLSKYEIEPINDSVETTCNFDPGPDNEKKPPSGSNPSFAQFRIKKIPKAGLNIGAESGGEGETFPSPLARVRLHFSTTGPVFDKATINRKDQEEILKKHEYSGIITPSNQWCSDVCGMATLEVWLACPKPGETTSGNLRVSSGMHTASVSFAIENTFAAPEETEETETPGEGAPSGGEELLPGAPVTATLSSMSATRASLGFFRLEGLDLRRYFKEYSSKLYNR